MTFSWAPLNGVSRYKVQTSTGQSFAGQAATATPHTSLQLRLSEIYGADKLTLALQDALGFEAYGCEYIANILEQRERNPRTPSALHLTHRQDLLDLDLPPADLTPYEPKPPTDTSPPL